MRMAAWLLALVLWPLAALAQTLPDPERLASQDMRFLQAALVWSGDYAGLTDGDWGRRSQEGLDAALARHRAQGPEAAWRAFLLPFAEEVAANGWSTLNFDGKLTVALPTLLLLPGPEGPDEVEFRSPDDSLVFRVLFDRPADVWDMHAWMLDAHAGPEEPYHSAREDRIVTAITMQNGKEVYLRSALIDGFALSMQVVNEPRQNRRADLIASSMQWGSAPDLLPVPGGPLDRLLFALRFAPEPPAVAALPEPAPAPVSGRNLRPVPSALPTMGLVATGTGFFVNNTDVVTAAHVTEGCRELRLEDGSSLTLLADDRALDLAVLASSRRSAHWLPLGPETGPRLGEPVFALGYPLFGDVLTIDQGLSVTGGNISALPRTLVPGARVSVTAPIQPGNSGGPLLSEGGAVLGVVVERANDLAVLAQDGIVPQNMNFATSVAQLAPFLEGAGVLFPSAAEREPVDLSQGIPDEVQAAVVLIGCY